MIADTVCIVLVSRTRSIMKVLIAFLMGKLLICLGNYFLDHGIL